MYKYKVGIIMGSDSDLPVMSEAVRVLEQLAISYEITIVSAHRTPKRLVEFAENAKSRGFSVIIAGAGGAAHLPGMVASLTSLPVIGVPIKTSTLNGLDSLYSIVQMPYGIPVATVAINGSGNAALLTAKILGVFDEKIAANLEIYSLSITDSVIKKAEALEKSGCWQYLENM